MCRSFYELKEIMIMNTTDPSATVRENPLTLHLVWPQWQGASVEAVRTLFSEVPLDEARRGYAVGTAVLNAVLAYLYRYGMIKGTMNTTTNLFVLLIVISFIFPTTAIRYAQAATGNAQESNNTGNAQESNNTRKCHII